MSKFDIKKAWPAAVIALGAAGVAHAQSSTKSILPLSGVYSSGVLGGSYFFSVTQGAVYFPAPTGSTIAAGFTPTQSATSGVLIVDLKGTGTTPTWGYAIALGLPVGTAATTHVNTMRSIFTTTTATCQVDYMIAQDPNSLTITVASSSVTNVVLTSGKAAASTDSTSCGASFMGRTGIQMTSGAQPVSNTVNYTHVF